MEISLVEGNLDHVSLLKLAGSYIIRFIKRVRYVASGPRHLIGYWPWAFIGSTSKYVLAYCFICGVMKRQFWFSAITSPVCHAHTTYGKAFAAQGKNLEMISQDACVFYNDVAHYSNFGGVSTGGEEGERIAQALGKCKAAILQNHGIISVGSTIESAVLWYIMWDLHFSWILPPASWLLMPPHVNTGSKKNAKFNFLLMPLPRAEIARPLKLVPKMLNSRINPLVPRRLVISLRRWALPLLSKQRYDDISLWYSSLQPYFNVIEAEFGDQYKQWRSY